MAASRPRPGRACVPQPTCEVGCFSPRGDTSSQRARGPTARCALGACGRGPTGPSGPACPACLRARRDQPQPWRGRPPCSPETAPGEPACRPGGVPAGGARPGSPTLHPPPPSSGVGGRTQPPAAPLGPTTAPSPDGDSSPACPSVPRDGPLRDMPLTPRSCQDAPSASGLGTVRGGCDRRSLPSTPRAGAVLGTEDAVLHARGAPGALSSGVWVVGPSPSLGVSDQKAVTDAFLDLQNIETRPPASSRDMEVCRPPSGVPPASWGFGFWVSLGAPGGFSQTKLRGPEGPALWVPAPRGLQRRTHPCSRAWLARAGLPLSRVLSASGDHPARTET